MNVSVVGVGARAPLGLSSLQLAMCVRARKFEPQSIALSDKRAQPVGLCYTGGIGGQVYGVHRMISLAAPAIAEALDGVRAALRLGDGASVPLVVSLPEKGRPDHDDRYDREILSMLADASGEALDLEASRSLRCGHAGFAHALVQANALLDAGRPAVLVGGVDSYFHPEVISWLDRNHRLHAPDEENGFVPGEGAAFLVLARAAKRRLARLLHVETAVEPAGAEDHDGPNIGEVVSAMLHRALGAVGPIRWLATDLNGERHRASEWDLAAGRAFDPDTQTARWSAELGDCAAASGALFAAIACRQLEVGAAVASKILVALHSDGVDRGVFVLEGEGSAT